MTHWGHLKTIVHGHPARLPVGWWPGAVERAVERFAVESPLQRTRLVTRVL